MNTSDSSVKQIDRIVSEISGILRAIGEPIPCPQTTADDAIAERLREARKKQLRDRERFLKRYQPAIMAFIGTILRDVDAAEQVWDQFVDKWLNGKLSSFDPSRGSFRKYLKTVLRNDCRHHWRQKASRNPEIELEVCNEPSVQIQGDAASAFDRELSSAIFIHAIDAVGDVDMLYGEIVDYMVRASRGERKKPSTSELSRHLRSITGHTYLDTNVRQMKKRAKQCFAQKIIEQTGIMIDSCLLHEIEETLAELNMLKYCRRAIDELRGE